MNREDAATTFLTLATSGKFDEDRESLKTAMTEAHATSSNKRIDVRRVFDDGDFVITLSHVVKGNPSDPDVAVIHVFKFKGERVVELWDLGQLMSKDSPNRNGAF